MKKVRYIALSVVLLLALFGLYLFDTSQNQAKEAHFAQAILTQKMLIQEIAKHVFYLSKNKDANSSRLDAALNAFVQNSKQKEALLQQAPFAMQEAMREAASLWQSLYEDVLAFKKQLGVASPYVSLLIEKRVRDIYDKNIRLTAKLDALIKQYDRYTDAKKGITKGVLYLLFLLLFVLLIYIALYLFRIDSGFDVLLRKIDRTIKDIEHIDTKAQEILEQNRLFEREDTVIEMLDELIASTIKLEKLKKELQDIKNR